MSSPDARRYRRVFRATASAAAQAALAGILKMRARLTLASCAVAAVVILWGTGLLVVRLRPYCVAKYRGQGANLQGALLSLAPLQGADLREANLDGAQLRGANLRRANLQHANLDGANLSGADLRGANLANTRLRGADIRGADLRGIETSKCANGDFDQAKGSLYDEKTRWDRASSLEVIWGVRKVKPEAAATD
jgi:uncharacterized protein YjbI with pentapeptide repeats